MCGIIYGFSFNVPSLASASVVLLPVMHVCALTLCMWIMFGVQYICLNMAAMSSLSGWWCWDVGCCMWLLIKYMLLRLSANTYVSCCVVGIFCMAMSIALSFALRMLGYPRSLSEIRVLLCRLNTHEPTVLRTICSSEFLEFKHISSHKLNRHLL